MITSSRNTPGRSSSGSTRSARRTRRVFDLSKPSWRSEDRRNSRKKIKTRPSTSQAPLTEQCRQETSSEEWLIRLPMQINLVSHQRLPRPTSWWRKRSSQSLTFHNSSNHCQSNSLTCGLPSTWRMTSLREFSSSLEKSTQSLRTQPHPFPISIVYSREDRLTAFLDSIKWFLRHRKLTEPNPLRAQDSRNKEKSILTIWVN